jgi:hypothetical protein
VLVGAEALDPFGIDPDALVPWNELAVETLDRFRVAPRRWTNTHLSI